MVGRSRYHLVADAMRTPGHRQEDPKLKLLREMRQRAAHNATEKLDTVTAYELSKPTTISRQVPPLALPQSFASPFDNYDGITIDV